MKKFIIILALMSSTLAFAHDANAQCFRFGLFRSRSCCYQSCYQPWCSSGSCCNASIQACNPCEAVAPCTATQNACENACETPAPCESVKSECEVTPCAPVEETVAPCEPVSTPCNPCDAVQCEAVQKSNVEYLPLQSACPNGTCPLSDVAKQLTSRISQLNATRVKYGLKPLKCDVELGKGCAKQALVCSRYGALYHGSGNEILAVNTTGFSGALGQWLGSNAGHRELLLSRSFSYVGIGVVRDSYGRFWCACRFR